MPVDPPLGREAARLFERTAGAGEGVDRDQALKRAAASQEMRDQRRTAERDEGAGGPAGMTPARGEAEKHETELLWVRCLEAIADPGNLAAAWATVRANAGAAGVDGQTVTAFAADVDNQLASLRRRLLSAERYVPPPVRRVEIPKPDGRMRPLGIPTVADRVVQQAVVQVIGPAFEAEVHALVVRLPAWAIGVRRGGVGAQGDPVGRPLGGRVRHRRVLRQPASRPLVAGGGQGRR